MSSNGPIRIVRMVYINWRICKPSKSLKQNVFHYSVFYVLYEIDITGKILLMYQNFEAFIID